MLMFTNGVFFKSEYTPLHTYNNVLTLFNHINMSY